MRNELIQTWQARRAHAERMKETAERCNDLERRMDRLEERMLADYLRKRKGAQRDKPAQ